MAAIPDTTPLRPAGSKTPSLAHVEVETPRQHYEIHSNGLYSNGEYRDLALLLKRNLFK